MPNATRDSRAEHPAVLLAWGMPAGENPQGLLETVGLWASGGAGLLVWTALAWWLTA